MRTDIRIDNEARRIWLITGVSSGLGLAFAQAALTVGHTVVGTVRNESDRLNFEKIQRGRAHAVVLDVSDFASIAPAVARVQQEIGAFGILGTAMAPGSFRTGWAGRWMVSANRYIADYHTLFDPIRQARKAKGGLQSGDPAKAAQILLEMIGTDKAPLRLVLGSDPLQLIRSRIDAFGAELDQWAEVFQASRAYTARLLTHHL